MNKARVLPRVAFWAVTGLTVAAAILRIVAFLTGYDAAVGYFRRSAVTIVYRILCACAVLISVLCAHLIPASDAVAPRIGDRRDWSAVIPLTASLWLSFSLFRSFLLGSGARSMGWIAPLAAGLALCAALYFLLLLLGTGRRNARGLLGMCMTFLCVLLVGLTYNDPYITMNSPVKLAVQFACVGVMLGMTAELRMLLGKPAPRLALPLVACAVFFCLAGALPCLIARAGGAIPATRPEGDALYLSYFFFAVLMGLYMLTRFVQLAFAKPDPSGSTCGEGSIGASPAANPAVETVPDAPTISDNLRGEPSDKVDDGL